MCFFKQPDLQCTDGKCRNKRQTSALVVRLVYSLLPKPPSPSLAVLLPLYICGEKLSTGGRWKGTHINSWLQQNSSASLFILKSWEGGEGGGLTMMTPMFLSPMFLHDCIPLFNRFVCHPQVAAKTPLPRKSPHTMFPSDISKYCSVAYTLTFCSLFTPLGSFCRLLGIISARFPEYCICISNCEKGGWCKKCATAALVGVGWWNLI